MIGYIVEIVWVIRVANANSRLWTEAEAVIDDDAADNDAGDYDEIFAEWQLQQHPHRRRRSDGGLDSLWRRCCRRNSAGGLFVGATRAHRIVEFDRMKARFIHQANKHHQRIGGTLDSNFPLAHYLNKRQHLMLESIVDMPSPVWVGVIVVMLLVRAGTLLPDRCHGWLFILGGWLILLATMTIRRKMRDVVEQITPAMPTRSPALLTQIGQIDFTPGGRPSMLASGSGSSRGRQVSPACVYSRFTRQILTEICPCNARSCRGKLDLTSESGRLRFRATCLRSRR
jgi:hypothetical protein